MSEATFLTVAILSLLAVVAILAAVVGVMWERGRRALDDARAEREAFDQGADVDAKMRKIATRARSLGR